jgi:hypothetical protein
METLKEKIAELEEERRVSTDREERIALLAAITGIYNLLAALSAQQGIFPPPVSVVFPHSSR